MLFEKNDIVRLKEEYFDEVKSKLPFPQNIFFVTEYSKNKDTVLLRNIDFLIPSAELCPVKIDGVEDRSIYYDPVVAADVVRPGEKVRSHHIDRDGYYIQQFEEWKDSTGKSYDELVQEHHCSYVHEIQHEMPNIGKDLKINYKVEAFIQHFPSNVKLSDIAVVMTYKNYVETEHDWIDYIKVFIEKGIGRTNMVATSVCINKPSYVLVFKNNDSFDARYAEFYINSSLGKLFLLNKKESGTLEGNTSIVYLRNLVIRWVDVYKECCVYLESLIQVIYVFEHRLGKEHQALTGLLSFLSQVRDAMVMEMMMPELFRKANFSVLKKWKRDTDDIMFEFYQADEASEKQIGLIEKLINNISSTNDGIVSEMAKYRIYMLEFLKFAEQNKAEL